MDEDGVLDIVNPVQCVIPTSNGLLIQRTSNEFRLAVYRTGPIFGFLKVIWLGCCLLPLPTCPDSAITQRTAAASTEDRRQ